MVDGNLFYLNGIKRGDFVFSMDVYYLQMSDKTQILLNQETVISDEVTAKSLELQQLEEQHDLLKTAVEMACEEQNPLDSYITKLNEQIDAKRHNLTELESKWYMFEEMLWHLQFIMIFNVI